MSLVKSESGQVDRADRVYGGRSAAQRTSERRAMIVQAAFELIAEDGWSRLRIERICRRARLNKRYFYESFTDLDAVAIAVMDRLAEDAIAITLAALDPTAPPKTFIRAGVAALVHHLTDDPRRARVLLGETPAGEAAAERRTHAVQQIVMAATAQGRVIHRLADEQDPILGLASAMVVGGTSQAVLDWLDGRLHRNVEDFIDDLAGLWQFVGDGAAAQARRQNA